MPDAKPATEPPSVPNSHIHPGVVDLRSVSLVVLAVLAVIAALKLAANVLVPITLSIFLSYLLMPLVSVLKRRLRVPEAIGAGVALILLIAVLCVAVGVLQPRATQLLDTLPQATQRMGRLLHNTALDRTSAIRKLTAAADALERAAGSALPSEAPPPNNTPAPNLRDHVLAATGATLKALGKATVIVALSYFLLISGQTFKRKLVRISGSTLSEKKLTLQILDEIDHQVQRYLLIQVGTSALVGIASGLAFFVFGLDNALFWGAAAGVLHLVPYIGATFIVVLSTLFAYLQFNSAQLAMLIGGSALAIAGLVGLWMVPWLTERVGRINAVATFITLLAWDWLWGVPGLLLGIPIMMAVMAVCERVSGLEAIAALLGSEPAARRKAVAS